MKTKAVIIAGFLLAVAIVLWLSFGRTPDSGGGTTSASAEPGPSAGAPSPGAPVTEISMLYSTEKKEWLEAAATDFRKLHPEVKLTLKGIGSLEGAQAILDGKEKPTLFSPSDSLIMNLLKVDWQTKNGAALIADDGDYAPESELITPLVFVAWEDRGQALARSGDGKISWRSIHKAVTSNKGWPAVGGKAEWGFVKLGHTDPTRSNSGLQALLLMTLEYYQKTNGLQVSELLDPKYQAFVQEIEKGVGKFEASTGTFMTEMIRFGPSKYDISVVYENLAISQIENAQGRWGNLRVHYPSTTLWSDHPVAILQGDWSSDAQKKAARLWMTHLHSRPVQEKALAHGFRPGDPSVPVKTPDGQNPFNRLAQYGISVDIPPVAQTPDGAVVRNLLTMWSRVVQR
ncbi:MAG: substrate-binding domain-containing protein [Polyangiaceae bacterium]